MQKLLAVFAVPLLFFGLAAAHKVPDREAEHLLGPVRSVSSKITKYIPGGSDKAGQTQQQDLVAYDDKGNEAERTIYDDYGFLGGRQVSKRDSNGHLVESVLYDPEGATLERQVYAYSDGKLAGTVHYDGKGEVVLREVNSYDEQGRLGEVTYYEGKQFAKTVYRYDGEGRGSEAAFFLGDGSKAIATIGPCLGAHRMTYTYDETGRSHQVVAYEPDGKVQKSWLYAYNDKGLMSEEKLADDHEYTTRLHAYEYDSRGNWIKRVSTVTERPKPGQIEFEGLAGLETRGMVRDARRVIISRKIAYY
jgi:antitoxin component YwqK of YwqJK toxin-antitoxin module